MRRLVAEILESSGYTVLQAADGPRRSSSLRRHAGPVDLLVTDVVMPGMSGPEVAERRRRDAPRHARALHLGLHRRRRSGTTASLEPGIAFLQKPFNRDALTRKVREVLDGVVDSVTGEAGTELKV